MSEFEARVKATLDVKDAESSFNSFKSEVEGKVIKIKLDPDVVGKKADFLKKVENLFNSASSVVSKAGVNLGQDFSNSVEKAISSTVPKKVSSSFKSFSDLKIKDLNIKPVVDDSGLIDLEKTATHLANALSNFGQVNISKILNDDGTLDRYVVKIEQIHDGLKQLSNFSLKIDNGTLVPSGKNKITESVIKRKTTTPKQLEHEALENAERIKEIQDRITKGYYDAQKSNLDKKIAPFKDQDEEEIKKADKALQEYHESLKKIKDIVSKDDITFEDGQEVAQEYEKMTTAVEKYNNAMTEVRNKYSKNVDAGVAERGANSVKTYYENNTRAAKKYGAELKSLEERYRNVRTEAEKLEIETEFKNLKSKISAEGLTGKSFFDELKRGFKQIGEFTTIYSLLDEIPQVIERMASETIAVDDAMTQLQMATNVSDSQAKQLMQTYSEMGDTLKATSVDVATSATEWLKQGKTIAESQELATESIILSKIGDLSSEESTSVITAAMKSYDLQIDEIRGFIDQISAIDMASATDVGGLATAFNEVAANAKQAGVETEKLLAYAAVIGETTQEGMASVGTSLNAIFSRMGNIKLSRLKDPESGEDLSNVETVLGNVGIKLRDSQSEFRDFDEVLDETASKWSTFSEVTQRSIAQAFSGTHHMNNFLVLMDQWNNVQKYTETALNSSGESMQKYEVYQESLTGKIEGLKNAFQSLSTTTIEGDFFGGLIDFGTGFLNVLDSVIDKVGILKGTLTVFAGIKFGKTLYKNFDKSDFYKLRYI